LEKMGKHPVIFLTLKNIKEPDWETCLDKLKSLIQREYLKHDYLLTGIGKGTGKTDIRQIFTGNIKAFEPVTG
ncbi:MAG TPA: hypothetical protein VK469_11030, partial [Candidatus Kapabacteria bacterium]|nr:hypothetical protein [Candidatus Kapabacteria bacterium]